VFLIFVLPVEVTTADHTSIGLLALMVGVHVPISSSDVFEFVVASFDCAHKGVVSVHVPPVEILACYCVIPVELGEHA
jgi:hypothetical protein